ncbi:MAG: hypothetical protein FJ147_28120 [Deltaproteobacteria bacterium]|nr:hypothetical protein [Deltaproteobacteria bacterium]
MVSSLIPALVQRLSTPVNHYCGKLFPATALLSESTATADKTEKKLIYQNQLKVAEYFWFDPFAPDDFSGFGLQHGVYVPIPSDDQGRLASRCLDLMLVRWHGVYEGVETTWLRWATREGQLLPTKDKKLQTAEQHAGEAEQRAKTAEQHAGEAEQRARTAEQRAADAEAEIARLRTLLAESKS